MSVQITSNQIDAFARTLVAEKIIDKSDVEVNKDLMEESLKLSQTTGLQYALYNNNYLEKSSTTPIGAKPIMRPYDGQQGFGTMWNPIAIFKSLQISRFNEIAAKEKHEQAENARIGHEFWLWQNRTPSNERWKDGKEITIEDFKELPFKCTFHPRCSVRFKTKQEADNHRWKHGG
jgi:hypothetical protein